ncbi:protein cortex-like isoform X2 [Ischnura elegans]|uniref:protein cortex-like isoform X2 n=1 Tax=Ischnura elegans TaxID=197161 RepID=UPI001ED8921D|nr:protein cortex-like isoform X2 [Ischnura elegans]
MLLTAKNREVIKSEENFVKSRMKQKKTIRRRELGDRFIPRRCNLDIEEANFYISRKEEVKEIFSQDPKAPSQLWCDRVGFSYHPAYSIFSYSNDNSKGCHKRKLRRDTENPWPIKKLDLKNRPGRLRPDHVYDLPNFRNSFYFNIIDWSSSGHLAASLGSSVYTWNPITFVRDTVGEFQDYDVATALKWHPDGKLLALGTQSGYVKVCDPFTKTPYLRGDLECESEEVPCCITSIAWHPSESMGMAVGCSAGVVSAAEVPVSLKGTIVIISSKKLFKRHVATLRFSPSRRQNGSYLAVGGRSDYACILEWPSLDSLLDIQLSSHCRAMAWHPWKSSLLAVGTASGTISVMNVMKEEIIQSYEPNVRSSTCCLEWCPQSGLLISSHVIEPDTTVILILSSLNKVEQKAEGKFGRILYILWSPDKSQIDCI